MKLEKKRFEIEGMTCASCASSVESILSHVEGVKSAQVNFADSSVLVEYEAQKATEKTMREAVHSIGYELVLSTKSVEDKEKIEANKIKTAKSKLWIATVLSVPVVVIAMFFPNMLYANWIMFLLSLPVMIYSGKEFFVVAWKRAINKSVNMDTLIALGTGAAFLFSVFNTFYPEYLIKRGLDPHVYYEVADIIIALVLLGRYFEERENLVLLQLLKNC